MTTSLPQGEFTIERMCALVGVSRAGYYRAWAVGATSRRDRPARRDPACGHSQSALRLPPDYDRDRS